MNALEKSAETYTVRDSNIEICFRYASDRWCHRVATNRNGRWYPLLESEEGRADDNDLPSPALQDLRFEEVRDRVFEFQLLGQAGKEIFSAAIRFDGEARTIDFDLCARSRAMTFPACTHSQYVLASGVECPMVDRQPSSLSLQPDGESGLIIAALSIADGPVGECRLFDSSPVQRIGVGCFGGSGPETTRRGVSIRWRYQMTLAGNP